MTGVFGHAARILAPIALVALMVLAGVPSGVTQPEAIDDGTCLGCHEGYDQHLAITAHRLASQTTAAASRITCAGCHAGAATHIEDPSIENITNPGTATPEAQVETCRQCHQPHTEMSQVGFDPHAGQNLACSDCHRVHSGTAALLIDDKADFCGTCHVSAVNDFKRRSNHPLTAGSVNCVSCHNFSRATEPQYAHGAAANCITCHAEQSGPYLYEHEAANSFTTEGGGCVACHAPHGSPNERLLTQAGNGLCRQCHGTPPGHRTNHDGLGVQFDCMECHTEVHGSYDNRALLNPNLGAELGDGPGSCWCHGAGN